VVAYTDFIFNFIEKGNDVSDKLSTKITFINKIDVLPLVTNVIGNQEMK